MLRWNPGPLFWTIPFQIDEVSGGRKCHWPLRGDMLGWDGSFILVVQRQRDCLGFTEDFPEIMALLIDLVENWSRWASGE